MLKYVSTAAILLSSVSSTMETHVVTLQHEEYATNPFGVVISHPKEETNHLRKQLGKGGKKNPTAAPVRSPSRSPSRAPSRNPTAGGTVVVTAASSANDLMNFDDLTFDETEIGRYHGLQFSNFYAYNNIGAEENGYEHGVISPDNIIVNGYANDASFTTWGDGKQFSVASLYVVGGWNDNLQVTFTGYVGGITGVAQGTKVVIANSITPTHVTFDSGFMNIDTIVVRSGPTCPSSVWGGWTSNGYGIAQCNIGIDNIAITLPV